MEMMYIQTVYGESQWQALTQGHRIAEFLSQVNRISSTVGGTGRIYMYILSEEPDVYICIVLSQEQEVNDPLRNREYKKNDSLLTVDEQSTAPSMHMR